MICFLSKLQFAKVNKKMHILVEKNKKNVSVQRAEKNLIFAAEFYHRYCTDSNYTSYDDQGFYTRKNTHDIVICVHDNDMCGCICAVATFPLFHFGDQCKGQLLR
jgi:hypothetical protein